MVLVKIDPSIIGYVCEVLEKSLAECYVQDKGIIGTDESGVGIMDSMKIKYEIVDRPEITSKDIYTL